MKVLTENYNPPSANYQLLLQKNYLTLYQNFTDHWLYSDWTGFITDNDIRAGSELLLQAVTETRCRKLINDNTNLSGIKADATDWLAHDFAPRLQAAGLQYTAWIYKTNSLAEASVDRVLGQSNTDILVIVFDKVDTAEKWLRNVR